MSNITVITNNTPGIHWYSKKTIPIIREYCERWNYRFIEYNEGRDPTRHLTWVKIPLILKTLDECSTEWVFWEDADSCPLIHTIPLEKYLVYPDAYIIIDTQKPAIHRANEFTHIAAENTGLWFIRNTQWSRDFLNSLLDNPMHEIWRFTPYHEQSAFSVTRQKILPPEEQYHIQLLPPYTMGWRIEFTGHFIHTFGDAKDLLLVAEHFVKR